MGHTITIRIRSTWLKYAAVVLVTLVVAAPVAVWASNLFTDVPDSNQFHDDIEWLADAEVTLGCTIDEFCPNDFVTRQQMAAFMRRLAENKVVDAATAVEAVHSLSADEAGHAVVADSLNFHSEFDLMSRSAFAGGDIDAVDVGTTDQVILQIALSAPDATGTWIINSSLYAVEGTAGDQVWCSISIGSGSLDFAALQLWESGGAGTGSIGTMSGTRAVTQGQGSISSASLVCRLNGAAGVSSIRDPWLTAIFVPA